MRSRILHLLRENEGWFASGEEISRKLAVSRTAVWKHIKELKQLGYDIEAHSRRGYCLHKAPDLLLPEEIKLRLKTDFWSIQYYDDVASTNNIAKQLAVDGAPEGTLVVAESQNAGRGRLARGWFAPRQKGIWMSVVLRPRFSPQDAPKCTLMAAVAICEAIKAETNIDCGIKWPNDILYCNKKLVGILTEMSAEIDAISHVVIGMGINVNIQKEDMPAEIAAIATSLAIAAGHTFNRFNLITRVLDNLEQYYKITQTEGFGSILERWRQLSVTLGQTVDVIGGERRFEGVAIDIDNDGALLVQTADKLERVIAGDVSIRAKLG